jgi:hypothetical protein
MMNKNMWDQLRNNFSSPRWWYHTALPGAKKQAIVSFTRHYFDLRSDRPRTAILDEDWDILIWLDGCRFDLFKQINYINGNLDYRYPKSIPTYNFLRANFVQRDLSDLVYVTAHPMYTKHDLGNEFYAVIDVWESDWDDELYTVKPESIAKASIEAIEKYPNKRIISHFMQPHYPFIGEIAQQNLDQQIGFKPNYEKKQGGNWKQYQKQKKPVWDKLRDGEVSKKLVWDCYRENLELTFPHVQSIINNADGKTVVTSDHGNMLGSRAWPYPFRVYGHPEIYTLELMKVPWLVINTDERREIIKDSNKKYQPKNNDVVAQRLEDFGYLDY